MAGYTLIDGYIDTMRGQIRWRRDLDDVVAEMKDHLYSAVETRLARGLEPVAAQRVTLDLFGEPRVLAAVYASTPNGGIAVPTTSTVRAGLFALVSGALWLVASLVNVLTNVQSEDWQIYYAIFSAAVLVAGVLGIFVLVGLNNRLGGLGIAGTAGVIVFGVGVALSIVAWAVPLWMAVQGVGLLIFGLAAMRRRIAPSSPILALTYGPLLGVAVFFGITFAELGPTDSYGDYELAWIIGNTVGLAFIAIGFLGLGRWLRTEEPVDIDQTDLPVAA